MDHVVLSAILAFGVAFFTIPIVIHIAKEKKLFDEPDERKIHSKVTPTLGGIGIFAGFTLAYLVGVPNEAANFLQFYVAAAVIIFFLGLKDDLLVLSASKKFFGQLVAAGVIIFFGNLSLDSMHGFFGIFELNKVASITLTVFTIIVVTNSFNLIDGIDGLAGILGVLSSATFGVYFTIVGEVGFAVMGFSLTGAVLAFLIYNFAPAKIFMGDTGSLLIGLVNAILVIKFINVAATTTSAALPINAAPAVGFAILMLPLFDTLRIFALRIINGRSPFSPDRNHIHHFLLDLGFGHKTIALTCGVVSIFFTILGYALSNGVGPTYGIVILLVTALLLTSSVYYTGKIKANRKLMVLEKSATDNTEVDTLPTEGSLISINKINEAEAI
jgi:UDP-GlcNAc:undecaprenyl-phosphate/decaprenyl-phosphate GlcNAc-1-phosphate transferase